MAGDRSLAIVPFIKIPTAAHNAGNGVVEYTVNAPYTLDLDTLWSVTAEPALGWLKNYNNTGHHGDYSFLVNVNRSPVFQDGDRFSGAGGGILQRSQYHRALYVRSRGAMVGDTPHSSLIWGPISASTARRRT